MDLSRLPLWLIVAVLLAATVLIGYAVFDGREVELWPPKIYAKGTAACDAGMQGRWQRSRDKLVLALNQSGCVLSGTVESDVKANSHQIKAVVSTLPSECRLARRSPKRGVSHAWQ